MAEFPAAIKNYLQLNDGVDKVIAQHPNERGDEITAIETFIGAFSGGQSANESLKNILKNYRRACGCEYKSAADLYVRAGEIAVYDAAGNMRIRRNTVDLTVTWADIDTGAEANSTLYYVYAVADATATTFTVMISTNATTPTGATFYRLIGSFYNNSAGNILQESVTSLQTGVYPRYGAAIDKSSDYGAQIAYTDGVVEVKIYNSSTGGTGGNAFGYTDANADPTTQKFAIGIVDSGIGVEYMRYASFTMTVKKGEYWKVTISGTISTITVYWRPIIL